MRIFHFSYDHTGNPWVGGGGAVRAYEIYKRLSHKHDITVVCGLYPGAKDYSSDGLFFRFVGTKADNYVLSTFCYAFKAAGFLKKEMPATNVIVEDFAPYNPIFSFRAGGKAVLQLHQREGLNLLRKYLFAGLPFFLIEKFYPRFFRNIVVVSETSRKKYDVGLETAVIGNGFDPKYLSFEATERDYLLFLGRIEIDSKGIDILLKGMSYLHRVSLRIAGKGKDEKSVRNLVKKTHPLNDVEMVGFLQGEAKVAILKDCMFVIIPSRFEGRPVTLLEAAAFGKPVIVSDIPELQCAVDAGFGLSFRRCDPEDLADKIRFLLDNKSLRREMGLKAREYARNYTWDRIAKEYELFLLDRAKKNGKDL